MEWNHYQEKANQKGKETGASQEFSQTDTTMNSVICNEKESVLFLAKAKAYCHFVVVGIAHWQSVSNTSLRPPAFSLDPISRPGVTMSNIIGHALRILTWNWKTTIGFSANKSRNKYLMLFPNKRRRWGIHMKSKSKSWVSWETTLLSWQE